MTQPYSDRVASTDSAEALNLLILDANEKNVKSRMLTTQSTVTIGPQRDNVDQWGNLSSIGYHKNGYLQEVAAAYTTGYDIAAEQRGLHLLYANTKGVENASQVTQSESLPAPFHGYCYSSQKLNRPYAPVSTQLTSAMNLGYSYDAERFSTSDPSRLLQPVAAKNVCILSTSQVTQAKLPVFDLQGDNKRLGLISNYLPAQEPSAQEGDFLRNSGGLGVGHQEFEGSDDGGLWSDWLKLLNQDSSMPKVPSSAVSPFALLELESSANKFKKASQQRGLLYQLGTCSGSSYQNSRSDKCSASENVLTSSMELTNQIWPALNEASKETRCKGSSYSSEVTLDMLSERNRGPRSSRPKFHPTADRSAANNKNGMTHVLSEPYNRVDFVTNYRDAKFFIIKSYSEDNVHKSIKYGIWASTPNGNKKLNAAYHEAKEKRWTCPIFLLFSVNASAQFCGVAEMVGPVDFNRSVDYWLQDKWSGQFPVKWHIIKDVPNIHFRHILLKNNDNKPVTNSRDTQEVQREQGIEMLNIFKTYEMRTSILDDFCFYEQRQKAMEEKKAKKQATNVVPPEIISNQKIPVSQSTEFIKKMSKSFAEAVSLSDRDKENPAFRRVVPATTTAPVGLRR